MCIPMFSRTRNRMVMFSKGSENRVARFCSSVARFSGSIITMNLPTLESLKNTIPMFSRTRNPLVTFSKGLPDSAAALPHFLETSFLRIFQHYKAKHVYTHVLKDDESYCDIYKRHRNQCCQVMDMVARFSRNIITTNLSPLER